MCIRGYLSALINKQDGINVNWGFSWKKNLKKFREEIQLTLLKSNRRMFIVFWHRPTKQNRGVKKYWTPLQRNMIDINKLYCTSNKQVHRSIGIEMRTRDFGSHQGLEMERKRFKILNMYSFLHMLERDTIFQLK